MIWSSCIVWRSESSSSCRCLTVCAYYVEVVGNWDNGEGSAFSAFEILHEVRRLLERKEIKMVLTDPWIAVTKKLVASNILDKIGTDWVFLSTNDAVVASQFALHQSIHKA